MNEEISLSQAFDLGTPSQDNIIPDGKEPVNTIAMQDVFKQREMNLDFVENMNRKKESGFLTDVSAGLERFYFGITDIPDNLKNAVIRGFNGHIFPNMTEQQATMLMESVTREQMARNQYRRNVEALEGVAPDSITANITSGIAQAVFYGLTGNFLGGIGMGIEAGLQAGGETNLQYAESYLAKHGSMQGYKGTDDFIYSSLNGAINGYIEQALGVENLFRGTIDKFVKGGARQFVRSAIEEGTEEVLQEYAGYGIGKLADYENVESYREQRSFAEATKDALVNGIYGAIIGGAVGGSLYMVNRGRIAKALREQYGLNEKESLEAATDYIENGSSKILDEVQINDELTNAFGESYEQLKTKIKDSIQATGTQIYGENIDEYVNLVAKDIGLQVITNARAFNIPTREYLDLANIQSFDNILSLERVDLNDVDVVKDLIKSKKAELKDLNLKQKTGIDTKAQRGVLTRQIAQLQVIQKKIDKPVSVEQKQNNPVLTDILGNKFNNITLTPQIKSMENLEIGEIINNMPELKTALKTVLPRTQGLNKENFAQIINSPANNNNLKENVMSYVVTYGTSEQIKEFLVNYSNKQAENLENKTGFSDRDLLLQALEESGIGTEQERRAVLLSETPSIDNTVEKQLFQSAYAGSRVDYDRPSLEAIGSGEGAMMHGYGLYYALDKKIAERYRYTFTESESNKYFEDKLNDLYTSLLDRNEYGKATIIESLLIRHTDEDIDDMLSEGSITKEDVDWFRSIEDKYLDKSKKVGQVHEVDIPEVDVLLDEQKTFNEQSEKVKDAIRKLNNQDVNDILDTGATGEDIYGELVNYYSKDVEADDLQNKTNQAQKLASQVLEKVGIKGITYEGGIDGRCFVIFNPEDVKVLRKKFDELGNVLFQERKQEGLLPQNANGYMDTELKTIVLGSNINQGTLPHEFAHFFLQKNFDLWKQGNPNAQFDMLAEQLGITKDQDMLTREQQEQFAYMTEAYIFGKGLGSNVSPVVKAYLNWIPAEYESVINMGYKRADGTEYNPVINDSMKNYFDTAYATLGLSTSPTVRANTNIPDDKGEPLPSNKEVRLDRSKQIKVEPETIKMTPQDSVNETKAMVKYGMPEDNWVSTIIPGQGTNTREQQQELAKSWVAENPEEAKRIGFGGFVETEANFEKNTSPVERAFVIRELMKSYNPDSVEYAMLKHNLATYLSLSGKALGLNNDLSFRTYLDSYAKLNNALREKAAFLRYGKSNKAVQLFDADVDKFIATWMDAVVNTKEDSQERDMAVKNFIESAKQEFETDTILMQENIFEQLKKANKKNFEAVAKNYVKKLAGALPTNQNVADLMKLANRAQALSKNIDSNNAEEAITAGKAIRELQNYIRDKGIPQGFMQKLIGGWMPRAMLSSPSTHLTNALSNSVQAGIIKATNRLYYGKNIVSTQVMNNEKARLKKIYENTGFNLAQQYTINDKALIKGERYETTPNAEAKGWAKLDPMKFLGDSDFFFRNNLYIDTLSHIASKNANGDVKKANELFNKYKQLATTDEESLKARQEALLVANIGVFTQNGKFAAILSQIRNSLDMINVDISKQGVAFGVKGNQGLGTMLAPFIKTPANIIELGARAIASPFTTLYTLAKGEKLSITQAIDLGEATTALLTFAALVMAGAKYQGTDDPYDRKSDTIQFGDFAIKLDNFGVMAQPLRQAMTLSGMYMGKDWVNTGLAQLPILSEVEKVKLMRDDFGKFINDFTAEQAGKVVPSLIKPITKKAIGYRPENKYFRKWTQSMGITQSRSAIDDWTEALSKVVLGSKIQFR